MTMHHPLHSSPPPRTHSLVNRYLQRWGSSQAAKHPYRTAHKMNCRLRDSRNIDCDCHQNHANRIPGVHGAVQYGVLWPYSHLVGVKWPLCSYVTAWNCPQGGRGVAWRDNAVTTRLWQIDVA